MNHQNGLRNLASSNRSGPLTDFQKELLYSAADRIDELENQVKMMNRLSNLTHEGQADLADRVSTLEQKIKTLPTQLDLENALMNRR